MNTGPTEEELLGYFGRLRNWGRWGAADSRGHGQLHHRRAPGRGGRADPHRAAVSCAWPIDPGPSVADEPGATPPQRFMLRTGRGSPTPAARRHRAGQPDERRGRVPRVRAARLPDHASRRALAYLLGPGDVNGRPAERVTAHKGADEHDITALRGGHHPRHPGRRGPAWRPWLAAGDGVTGDELSAILDAAGITVRPRDALLLRTGYGRKRREQGDHVPGGGHAGWHASCLPSLHEWQVSMVGADTAQDVVPSGYATGECRCTRLRHRHGHATARQRRPGGGSPAVRAAGPLGVFFTLAPLAFTGATGSAVNPLAIF